MYLNALGETPFNPGVLSFASLEIACLNSVQVIGSLSSQMIAFGLRFDTYCQSTGRFALYTFSKYGDDHNR